MMRFLDKTDGRTNGQMGDKWGVHLSRQLGRTNGVWVYRHTPYVLLSQDIWYL